MAPRWDPYQVLEFDSDMMLCAGKTTTGRIRECHNRVTPASRSEASRILKSMASMSPESPEILDKLTDFSRLILCKTYHSKDWMPYGQVDNLVQRFQKNIADSFGNRNVGRRAAAAQTALQARAQERRREAERVEIESIRRAVEQRRLEEELDNQRSEIERRIRLEVAEAHRVELERMERERQLQNAEIQRLERHRVVLEERGNALIVIITMLQAALVQQLNIQAVNRAPVIEDERAVEQDEEHDAEQDGAVEGAVNDAVVAEEVAEEDNEEENHEENHEENEGENEEDNEEGEIANAGNQPRAEENPVPQVPDVPDVPEDRAPVPAPIPALAVADNDVQAPDLVREAAPEPEIRRRVIDEDCPICYEAMESLEDAVWCRAQCGGNVHRQCFEQWSAHAIGRGRPATCCLCRADWV